MDPELIERRERTFELLIVRGVKYGDVVDTIASEYDISEAGVRMDIGRMEDWLPKLVESDHARKDGLVRLKELRHNRREMRRLYEELKERVRGDSDADPQVLLNVLEKIDDNIDLDIALSQSLGMTEREPQQLEVDHEIRVNSDVVEATSEDLEEDEDE